MNNLPVMLLKGLVLLPTQEVRLELNNFISRDVINLSSKYTNDELLIVCPKDQIEENPEVNDLPLVGVVGKIRSKIELPNGNLRVVIAGERRVKILEYLNHPDNPNVLEALVEDIVIFKLKSIEEKAYINKLLDVLRKYITESPYISNSVLSAIKEVKDLYKLTDMVTSFIPFPVSKKLSYMENTDPIDRAEKLITDLSIELEVLAIDSKIENSIRDELENNQKEFILREKIRQIKKELGEDTLHEDEIEEYKSKLESLSISDKSKVKILNEIKKYEYTPSSSPDSGMLRTYLDWVLNIPWGVYTNDNNDLNKIMRALDKTHYGLNEVKNRIVEYIAVKIRNPDLKSPIICLVGPPGVGKTTLAKTIAVSLKKEFYKISVGGLNDSAELVGHRRTYLGSNPGKIIQAVKKCESSNPVILIDEIDKMVKDYKGDPASSLLDILDPEQNYMFVDNYIEEPYDLSKVLFILTANDIYSIPEALKDRLEVIELSSYTDYEKIDIAKKYLLPAIYKNHLVTKNDIKINEDVISTIIMNYTREAGVRDLERKLSTIIRKIVTENIKENNPNISVKVKKGDLLQYLGQPKYEMSDDNNLIQPGLVNGLAYTPYGGSVMPLEACYYEGHGNISFTGMLQQSMKESSEVAISYIKSNKDYFKISDYYFSNKDIHLHALDGAIPKDGPSAGITIVTSVLSLILGEIVDKSIAMTGEVTVRGEVHKIGGLREKVIGAYNEGIRTVYLPKSNKGDLDIIPDKIKEKIEFRFVTNYKEIYDDLFR